MKLQIGPIRISCAHFLTSLPASHKCRNLHGHNYIISVTCHGSNDPLLVEGGEIVNIIKELDHLTLLPLDNPIVSISSGTVGYYITITDTLKEYYLPDSDCKPLHIIDTTAECLSSYYCEEIIKSFPNLTSVTVKVSETESLSAENTLTRDEYAVRNC